MNRPEVEAVLNRWELGAISAQDAAGELVLQFLPAVRTRWWRRRAEAVGEPAEALEGLLYETLVEKIPKYLRCYNTKLLTLALQGLKDRLRSQEGGRDLRKRTSEKAHLDPSIWVGPGGKDCFIAWLSAHAAEIADGHRAGRGTLIGQRHRQLIEAVVQGAPLSLSARAAGISTDLAKRVLARDFAIFATARGIDSGPNEPPAEGVL